MRLVLENDVVRVRPDALFASPYTAQSPIKVDRPSGTYSFGTIKITDTTKRNPFRLHNLITRAFEGFQSAGVTLSQVTVVYPAKTDHNHYGGGSIYLVDEAPFSHEAGIFHEYAHHFMETKSESPIADYTEGGPWHDDHWAPELGVISWTEGFPDFYAALLFARHVDEHILGASTRYKYETRQPIEAPESEWDRIEGVIAAILWDIVDSADDDQDGDGPGRRDNLDMSFADVLKVITDYDPEPFNPFHNHPVSIHELFDGFRELFPAQINKVAEVYREHHFSKPLPDLRVLSTGALPASVRRGQTVSSTATITNAGGIFANSAFQVQWQLIGAATITGETSHAANMSAGAVETRSGSVTIPATAGLGEYKFRVCVDTGSAVPETNEGNNCLTGPAVP